MAMTVYSASPTWGNGSKGSWAQLVASTPFASSGVLFFSGGSADVAAFNDIYDLGTGGSGSEVVVISNALAHVQQRSVAHPPYYFPLAIPIGTRLACRGQTNAGSRTGAIYCWIIPSPGIPSFNSCDLLADRVSLTSAGSPSWTQLNASITNAVSWVILAATTATNNVDRDGLLLDIATGAAASESVIIPSILLGCRADGTQSNPGVSGFVAGFPLPVAASSRLAGRITFGGTATAWTVSMWGLRNPASPFGMMT